MPSTSCVQLYTCRHKKEHIITNGEDLVALEKDVQSRDGCAHMCCICNDCVKFTYYYHTSICHLLKNTDLDAGVIDQKDAWACDRTRTVFSFMLFISSCDT